MSNFTQMDEMDDIYMQDKDAELIPTNVDHKAELSSDFEELFHKQDFSDVTFVVEGERIPCHRVILAMRSEYFRALLYGGLKETTEKEIKIHDANHYTFKNLIKYIYTGKVQLLLTEEQIIDMLGLAHKFFLRDLEKDIAVHLRDIINFANFCTIFNVAQMYAISSLIENCLQFADYNAQNILRHESFTDLSIKAVEELAARDSFCAPEIDIFRAVRRWIEADPDRTQYSVDLLSKLRLPLIPQKDLLGTVRPSALLSSDDLLDAIHVQQNKRTSELIHRGCKNPDINVACIQYGAKVLRGMAQGLFLSGDFLQNLPDCRIHTRHDIGDSEGIVVELGKSFIINTIRLYLPDREQKMYSYYVELSMDDFDWVRVIDYSNIPCRGMQNLVFSNRAVKFLKIVGVSNSMANKHFDVTAIEALFSTDKLYRVALPPFDDIVWPSDNVATIEKYATVIEGVSRSRNALLNGHTDGYDWDTGYTCHQVGSGSITVQFPQPYVVNSMRLLLWDCDDRYYSYYVEVSVDNKEWMMVADRRNAQCRSWQLLNFPTCAVVFVRIIGVHNSANEVFHCVHFECPAGTVAKLNEECSLYEPPVELKLKTLSVAGPSHQHDN